MDVRDMFNMLPQIIMNILVIVQIVTWVIRTMMVVALVLLRAPRAQLYKPVAPDPSPAWTTVVPTLTGPLYLNLFILAGELRIWGNCSESRSCPCTIRNGCSEKMLK